jgi:hypothetical protein
MAESLLELDGKLEKILLSLSRKLKMLVPNYVRKPGRMYDLKNVAEWLDGTGLHTAGNSTAK